MIIKTIDEAKKILGFIYASIEFNNLETDIELAQEEIIKVIGQEVFDLALNHYNGEAGSGSGSGSGSTQEDLLDELVKKIQLPVLLIAYKNFTANNDVTHSNKGRQIFVSDDEKPAFEWMIERDDQALLFKSHRTTDRLIKFLDDNIDSLSEWKNSNVRITQQQLFVSSTSQFNEIYPIDQSRAFYIKILPFIKEAERNYIKPILTPIVFDALKDRLVNDELTSDDQDLLNYIRIPEVLLAMSIAVKRLPIQVWPDSISSTFSREIKNKKATKLLETDLRNQTGINIFNEAANEIEKLQHYLAAKKAEQSGEEISEESITGRNSESNKHLRL